MSHKLANVVVMRHGTPVGVMLNHAVDPLSLQGVEEATVVANKVYHNLGVHERSRIWAYSSPVARATQTVVFMAKKPAVFEFRPELGLDGRRELPGFVEKLKKVREQCDLVLLVTHQAVVPMVAELLTDSDQLDVIYSNHIGHAEGFIIDENNAVYFVGQK